MVLHLRTKLILSFLGLALLPLALSAALNLRTMSDSMTENTKLALTGAVSQTTAELDGFVLNNFNIIRTHSLLPAIQAYLELDTSKRSRSPLESDVIRMLDSFRRMDQVNIISYALLDRDGKCLLDTAGIGQFDPGETTYIMEAARTGLPSAYTLYGPSTRIPSIAFASAVRNGEGEVTGLLRMRYNLSAVQKLIFEKEGLLGPGSAVILLDEKHIRIADSHDRESLFQPMAEEEVHRMLASPVFTGGMYPRSGETMLSAASILKTRPWIVAIGVPQALVLATVRKQALYTLALLVALAIAAVIAALFSAQALAQPTLHLTAIIDKIAKGDFHQRVDKTSGDEIGQLAAHFNTMASALQVSRQELLDYAQRLEVLLDTIPDAVFVHGPGGEIRDVNRMTPIMYGYEREEMLGSQVEDLSGAGYTQAMAGERVGTAVREGGLDFEWMGKRKDGSEFPVFVRLRRMAFGEEIHVMAVVTDMTERKKLEAQLVQAQKMQAIGTLAGGIAHDFNNLLMGIQGCASLMLMDTSPSHPSHQYLRRIEEQVKSGASLTRQILGFARGGKYEVRPLDLNAVVQQSADTFGRTKKEVLIHRALRKDLWIVEADQSQVEQVLLNLYVNAWQAMSSGGDLYLETGNVELNEDEARIRDLPPGKYVKLIVRDSGIGMDGKTLARIFEPFFTTKEMGRGTGLGLASAYGIMRNHGGSIEASSQPGYGSVFTLHFPASALPIEAEHTSSPLIPKGQGTILLVDDEQMIVDTGRRMLEHLGYQVLCTSGGKEALSLFQRQHAEIDLVILDMIMPEMGGEELCEHLVKIKPQVRIILSSGYSLDDKAKRIIERSLGTFIQKPFGYAELAQTVSAALNG